MDVKRLTTLLLALWVFSLFPAGAAYAASLRNTLSLDGSWQVEDSVGPDQMPQAYHHTAPVPGLTHSALPAFPDVDRYQSKQLLSTLTSQGRYSADAYAKLGNIRGISGQQRNYFWYRKQFKAPAQAAVAIVKINKAQFGAAIYLNGVKVGEHLSCFTAAYVDVSKTIRWNAPNELVIRMGAHPGVLPMTVSGGTDFEKNRWTPGIYDSVSLMTMNNPVIATTQSRTAACERAAPVTLDPCADRSGQSFGCSNHDIGVAAGAGMENRAARVETGSGIAAAETRRDQVGPAECRDTERAVVESGRSLSLYR